ncbi:MAG: DUF177 domain-containing protein [Fulvivirga sp.]|nr:DUF177 domain-containing protein [Fulvivirga sp.]
MKLLDQFNIDIYKLKNGSHDYHFSIGNDFLEAFPGDIIDNGSGEVYVTLEKSETLIEVSFTFDMVTTLLCDRSLEEFEYPIKTSKALIYKFGDEEKDLDDEIVIIPTGTQRINLAQHIYDYLSLEIPMKKLHPRYGADDEADDELVYTSTKEAIEESKNEEAIDPRWEALQKLNRKN